MKKKKPKNVILFWFYFLIHSMYKKSLNNATKVLISGDKCGLNFRDRLFLVFVWVVLLSVSVQHSWKALQIGCQDSVKGDNGYLKWGVCLIEVKITVIVGNKFQDFDNRPLNTVPLNTGSTVIGILKNPHKDVKTNPLGLKLSQSFTRVVRFVTWLISSKKHCLVCN